MSRVTRAAGATPSEYRLLVVFALGSHIGEIARHKSAALGFNAVAPRAPSSLSRPGARAINYRAANRSLSSGVTLRISGAQARVPGSRGNSRTGAAKVPPARVNQLRELSRAAGTRATRCLRRIEKSLQPCYHSRNNEARAAGKFDGAGVSGRRR